KAGIRTHADTDVTNGCHCRSTAKTPALRAPSSLPNTPSDSAETITAQRTQRHRRVQRGPERLRPAHAFRPRDNAAQPRVSRAESMDLRGRTPAPPEAAPITQKARQERISVAR